MPPSRDFPTLLTLVVRLIQSRAGTKIETGEAWLNNAQILSIKMLRHLVSMHSLATGATIEQADSPVINYIDHASVKVIARAAFETYLVFFFIYGDPDRNLSEFRYKIWELGGLMDRQQFHTIVPEHHAKLAEEKTAIDKLRAEILISPYLQTYTEKQRQRLLQGDWRIGNGWSNLGVSAGFHKKYFNNVYGYLCGYSHSSYISALQIGQAESIDDQRALTQTILDTGAVVMAHFAFTYSELFPKAGSVLTENQEMAAVAKNWRFGVKAMAKIYGA